jgi:hypothetical protein
MIVPSVVIHDENSGKTINLRNINRMLNAYRLSTDNAEQLSLAKQLAEFKSTLRSINNQLARDINAGYDLLREAPESPESAERLGMWLQWLTDYEATSDALSAIHNGMTLGRWDWVSERRTE